MIDFTLFPFTHELIFKKILLYSGSDNVRKNLYSILYFILFFLGAKFTLNCLKVCSTWKQYLKKQKQVWEELLEIEACKAQRFAVEARTSVQGVGQGWLDHSASMFIIRKLEFDFMCAYFILSKNVRQEIFDAVKDLGKSLSLAEKIKQEKFDPNIVFQFLKHSERRSERFRDKSFLKNEEAMHEFMLSTSEESGFSTETFYQV